MTKNEKQIINNMLVNVGTETPLRVWKRRLIVALTDEEKQRCKMFIKKYGG
jgi:hypothetical protein